MTELSLTAQTPGKVPIEVRLFDGGIKVAPAYLESWFVERVERDAVAATPAGPVFVPSFEGSGPEALYLAIEVLNEIAEPGTISVWGEMPDFFSGGLDPDDDLWDDDDAGGGPEPDGGANDPSPRFLRLVTPLPEQDDPGPGVA